MPLSLPVDPIKPLSDQEAAPLKDALIQWASSNRRLDASALKENLRVQAAKRVPVYEIALTSLVETRSPAVQDAVQPYSEDVLAADGDPAVNVWDFPSETKADFAASKGSYVIESTRRRRDCAACGAAGVAGCEACAGEGRLACANCRGRGRYSCDFCNGMAKTKCLKCSGRGMKAGVTLMVSAKDACEDCQGTGHLPCTRCEHGTIVCPQCAGGGKKNCDVCDAKGKRSCPVCQGRGKVVKAKTFQAEFAPVTGAVPAAEAAVPKVVMDKAMSRKKPGGTVDLEAGGLSEEAANAAAAPESVKGALRQLLQKLKPSLTATARVARQKVSWSVAELVRLDGTFFDQEFVAWIDPATKDVFLERDPLRNLGEASGQAAQHAYDAKDWKKALDLARKTLNFNPHHPDSQKILEEWKKKAWMEGLGGGLLAGAAVAGCGVAWIVQWEKGLNKTGPVLQLAGLCLAAGALFGFASFPALLKSYQKHVRAVIALVPSAVGLALLLMTMRFGLQWNPVAAADQKALSAEMAARFPKGVSEVYWEDDLKFLEDLKERYKDTQADLAPVLQGREKQVALKAAKEKTVADLAAQLAAVSASTAAPDVKTAQLKELRGLYELNSMDPAPVDQAMAAMAEQRKRAAEQVGTNRGRISILSGGRQIVKPSKEEAKKLAKQQEADLKKLLASSASPKDKKRRLETLQKTYDAKGADTSAIAREIKKIDQQLAKTKPAAKKAASRKR